MRSFNQDSYDKFLRIREEYLSSNGWKFEELIGDDMWWTHPDDESYVDEQTSFREDVAVRMQEEWDNEQIKKINEVETDRVLQKLYSLTDREKTDEAIDLMFSVVNAMISMKKYEFFLKTIDINRLNSSLIVALLTITLPLRSSTLRSELVDRAELFLREKEPDRTDQLLDGLR